MIKMSNSSLVNYTKISPNKGNYVNGKWVAKRTHTIDTISIHCVAGQASVQGLGNLFADPNREASSNYGIGYDGQIGMYVEEKDRSWCTSSASNDNRAITIEVASDAYHPYAVKDAAYKALIKLLVDICKRNKIEKLLWKDDSNLIGQVAKQNMTVHRWFANKACPGDWLYSRHGQIANEVNKQLTAQNTKPITKPSTSNTSKVPFKVRVSVPDLYIRAGAGTNTAKRGFIPKGVYTIVETKKNQGYEWGKLKSGAGWIALDYTTKL